MAQNRTLTLGAAYSASGGTATTYSALYGQSSDGSPALWQDRTNSALRPGLFPEYTISVKQAQAVSPYRLKLKVVQPKVDLLTNPDFPLLQATGFAELQVVIPVQMTLIERKRLRDALIEAIRGTDFTSAIETLLPIV